MKYALISDNMVVQIRDLTDEEFQILARVYSNIVDISTADPIPQVGDLFTGTGFIDQSGSPIARPRKIRKISFRQRMTTAEKIAILKFADGTSDYAYAVRSSINDQNAVDYLDLASPTTIAGLNNLTALGLLAPGRAAEILNAPITDAEKYEE